MVGTVNKESIYRKTFVVLSSLIILFYTWHALLVFEWSNLSITKSSTPSIMTRYSSGLNEAIIYTEAPCEKVRYPERYLRRDTMQSVGSVNATLVYSAYHDERNPGSIKIVGVCYKNQTHYCQLWYKEVNGITIAMTSTKGSIFDTNASNRKFSCCYIICPLADSRIPFTVSITIGGPCLPADNLLEVSNIEKKNYTRNFTMCHSALHYNFSDVHGLVQWIELNRMFGADNFIIYNFSSAQNVHNVLKYYDKLGIVKVLQWPLPSKIQKGKAIPSLRLHYIAQTSAYNDCLLRSKADSEFVVITDMDEFLVPHKDGVSTWIDLMKYLPVADAYYFRHYFFPVTNYRVKDDHAIVETAEKYHVSVLLNLERQADNFPFGQRTKYIARTSKVSNLRAHMPYGNKHYNVNSELGFLHHYRVKMVKKHRGLRLKLDPTVLNKYGHDLVHNIETVWSHVNG